MTAMDRRGDWRCWAGDLAGAARSAGVDAVVTDHNCGDGIDPIREVAVGGPVVIPGMELSMAEGHLLALFRENTPVEDLRKLLRNLGLVERQ